MTLNNAEKPSDISDTEWDEAKLVSALNHLQNMHIQVRNLRQSMSRVLYPLLTAQSSPVNFYSQFACVATDTAKHIQDFKNLVEGNRSQEVLKKAKTSRAEHPEGIKAWMINEHPDWSEVKSEDATLDSLAGNENTTATSEPV